MDGYLQVVYTHPTHTNPSDNEIIPVHTGRTLDLYEYTPPNFFFLHFAPFPFSTVPLEGSSFLTRPVTFTARLFLAFPVPAVLGFIASFRIFTHFVASSLSIERKKETLLFIAKTNKNSHAFEHPRLLFFVFLFFRNSPDMRRGACAFEEGLRSGGTRRGVRGWAHSYAEFMFVSMFSSRRVSRGPDGCSSTSWLLTADMHRRRSTMWRSSTVHVDAYPRRHVHVHVDVHAHRRRPTSRPCPMSMLTRAVELGW